MPTVSLEYAFSDSGRRTTLHNRITATLTAVAETGSLMKASSALGYSYRHLWNLVNNWEKELGVPLLERGRGHVGTLSPVAKRWLSAEKEVLAHYAETLTSLRSDLERSFACAVNEDMPLIRLAGCPDEAISLLRQEALGRKFLLEVNFNSSLCGLQELTAGRCEIAGFNFPLGENTKTALPREFRKYFETGELMMIGFATRIQGLAVAAGNPRNLCSMLDVSFKQARYVNRTPGTGTRILCDSLLRAAGIRPEEIVGYDNVAASHEAVAAQVALGKADAGLCIQSVTDRAGISFIPLVKEAYYLACRKTFVQTEAGKMFMKALTEGAWREKAQSLTGYDFGLLGKV